VVAVTGTNGKTSVTVFLRQIWERAGFKAASLGTIGLVSPGGAVTGSLTTPDPIRLHETMADLAEDQGHAPALEASSHGLEQRRLDGVRFSAGAFTNLSRDHLDYHATLEDYLAAKLRLFDALLPKGAAAITDADQPQAARVRDLAKLRELEYLSVGEAGDTLRLLSVTRMNDGSRLMVEAWGEKHYVSLPLVGQFQISNALVAAALAISTGVETTKALDALSCVAGRKRPPGAHRRPSDRGARIRRLCAHARRAGERLAGGPSPCGREARGGVRGRRRPRSRQAAADGRSRAQKRRPADRHGR
jgi:UDP-N-acetylmuramoyl-L-alanyl-D-glutamate--2,6-diaminopimelate ligase